MNRYIFYRNQKITVIECRYFSIEAENLETAVQKIKDLCADGQLDELSNDPTYQEDAAYQLALDFNLGLGYLNADFEKYEVIDGVRVRRGNETKDWCGPINAGVTLVWKLF